MKRSFIGVSSESVYINVQLQLTAGGDGPPGVSQGGVRKAAGLGVRLEEVAS